MSTARRLPALLFTFALLATACSSDYASPTEAAAPTDESSPADDTTPTDEETGTGETDVGETGTDETDVDESGVVDLTNAILVSTESNCGAYVGEYESMITDVSTGTDFVGSFTVSASDGTCTFASNQIPNHDAGESSRFVRTWPRSTSLCRSRQHPQLQMPRALWEWRRRSSCSTA